MSSVSLGTNTHSTVTTSVSTRKNDVIAGNPNNHAAATIEPSAGIAAAASSVFLTISVATSNGRATSNRDTRVSVSLDYDAKENASQPILNTATAIEKVSHVSAAALPPTAVTGTSASEAHLKRERLFSDTFLRQLPEILHPLAKNFEAFAENPTLQSLDGIKADLEEFTRSKPVFLRHVVFSKKRPFATECNRRFMLMKNRLVKEDRPDFKRELKCLLAFTGWILRDAPTSVIHMPEPQNLKSFLDPTIARLQNLKKMVDALHSHDNDALQELIDSELNIFPGDYVLSIKLNRVLNPRSDFNRVVALFLLKERQKNGEGEKFIEGHDELSLISYAAQLGNVGAVKMFLDAGCALCEDDDLANSVATRLILHPIYWDILESLQQNRIQMIKLLSPYIYIQNMTKFIQLLDGLWRAEIARDSSQKEIKRAMERDLEAPNQNAVDEFLKNLLHSGQFFENEIQYVEELSVDHKPFNDCFATKSISYVTKTLSLLGFKNINTVTYNTYAAMIIYDNYACELKYQAFRVPVFRNLMYERINMSLGFSAIPGDLIQIICNFFENFELIIPQERIDLYELCCKKRLVIPYKSNLTEAQNKLNSSIYKVTQLDSTEAENGLECAQSILNHWISQDKIDLAIYSQFHPWAQEIMEELIEKQKPVWIEVVKATYSELAVANWDIRMRRKKQQADRKANVPLISTPM